MDSLIAKALNLKYRPVAIILTDEKPEDAIQFKEGKFGCVMALLSAASRGRQAVASRDTVTCPGGGTGLGFGNQFENLPGGVDIFCRFLSVGNEGYEPGMQITDMMKPFVTEEIYDNFKCGERYLKTPELVRKFIDCLPITDVPFEYVVFRPLSGVDPEQEKPEVVVFLADMDQLSALVVLANHDRDSNESVIIPQAAGCQSIGIYPFKEARSQTPRAVVGLVDITARVQVKRQLKGDFMSFAVPFAMFLEMEGNVPGSFLERNTWKELMRLKDQQA
jgi:uncharacterized protein (DUF169 family)